MKKRAKKKSYTIDRKKWKLYFRKKCRSLKTEKVKTAIEWGTEIIVVCILAWMLVSFFGQRVSNAGDSMSPVLKNGDVVLINRIVYEARLKQANIYPKQSLPTFLPESDYCL